MNPPTEPDPLTPTPAPSSQYEFTADQNKIIDDLSYSMIWVAAPLLVAAVLYGLTAIVHFTWVGQDTRYLVPAGIALLGMVFFFLLSLWLRKTATAFDRVTATRGFDITHLMNGLASLRNLFRLLALLIQVYVALLIVVLVVSLVLMVTKWA